jgi:hypothetical protein
MGKYISTAILLMFGSVGLLFLISSLFDDQSGAISFGFVLILLLSIIITQLIRVADLLKKK